MVSVQLVQSEQDLAMLSKHVQVLLEQMYAKLGQTDQVMSISAPVLNPVGRDADGKLWWSVSLGMVYWHGEKTKATVDSLPAELQAVLDQASAQGQRVNVEPPLYVNDALRRAEANMARGNPARVVPRGVVSDKGVPDQRLAERLAAGGGPSAKGPVASQDSGVQLAGSDASGGQSLPPNNEGQDGQAGVIAEAAGVVADVGGHGRSRYPDPRDL